jgi:hypothetical protein
MSWETLADELYEFAGLLTGDTETERAGQTLYLLFGALNQTWLSKRTMRSDRPIPIPPPRDKGMHPKECKTHEAELRFFFNLGGDIETKLLPAIVEFQVCVRGIAEYPDCIIELEDHWRVDTHSFAGTPREPHPFIHFQRGGYAQDSWAASPTYVPGPSLPSSGEYWRGLLQSSGPRIAQPPLCPILMIDFAISQHDGDVWSRLRAKPEYRSIIANAQARLWNPFFEGLSTDSLRRRWLGALVL